MSSGFSFPPPPPPPPRQNVSSGQSHPQQQQQHSRGGRGGQRGDYRGRGGLRGRGQNRGPSNRGVQQQQQNSLHPSQPQPQQWMNSFNDWAAQHAQNVMGMYGLSSVPTQALPLPNSISGGSASFTDPSQANIRYVSDQHSPSQGVKRKREVKPRQPAAPSVPSFGAPIPSWRPTSSGRTPSTGGSEPKNQTNPKNNKKKKQKKKNNQLGLTPQGDERELSDDDDDEDEEARFAAAMHQNGPITVLHNNKATVLATPEDMKAWLDERKRKFPTTARVEEKKREEADIVRERNQIQAEQRDARRKKYEENKQKQMRNKEQSHLPGGNKGANSVGLFEQTPRSNGPATPDQDASQMQVDFANSAEVSSQNLAPGSASQSRGLHKEQKQAWPGKVKPKSRLERLQSKAEKYRKLAADAEIDALKAKASALGFSLVRAEVSQQPLGNLDAMVENADPPGGYTASLLTRGEPVSVDKVEPQIEVRLPGLKASHPEPVPLQDSGNGALFTVDVTGDESIRIDDGNMPASMPDVSSDSESLSSSSLSSGSSDSASDDDDLSDSSAGDVSEGHPSPTQPTATSVEQPPRSKKPCNAFIKQGHCRFGDNCKFSHDAGAIEKRRQADKNKKAEEERVRLHARLVEQEQDEQNALALNAIKFLGERGLLREEVVEGNGGDTGAVNGDGGEVAKS